MTDLSARVTLVDDLVGVKEAADLFGVQRSNFVRDLAARPDFPRPVAELAATRVWRRSDLLAFRSSHADSQGDHRPGRRRMSRIRSQVSQRLEDRPISVAARRWLPEMTARLVRRFRPDRVVLFGSQATGHAEVESDVDLLVVLPRVEGRKLDHTIAVRRALRGIPVGKDVVITTPAEVARFGHVRGLLLHDVLKDGVVLYDRTAAR